MNRAADSTGSRSGSLVPVIGVGTHTNTASASSMRALSVPTARKLPSRAVDSRSSVMSSIGEWRSLSSATRPGDASTPSTSRPASAKAMASGRPT